MKKYLFFLLLLLSGISAFPQNNNIKFSVVALPGYAGISFGYERKVLKKASLNLQFGAFGISWFDFSNIDPVGYPPRTDLRIHLDFRKYLTKEKAEKLYGRFLIAYVGYVKQSTEVEEPWMYEPPKYEYIDHKFTGGFGIGNKSKISKNSNLFLEYAIAPGFGVMGNTSYYYHFEIRIIVAVCIGF
jgi:hypothetical protein